MRMKTWVRAIILLLVMFAFTGLISSTGLSPYFLGFCAICAGICMDLLVYILFSLICMVAYSYAFDVPVVVRWRKAICMAAAFGLYLILYFIGYAPGHYFAKWYLTSTGLIGG